MNRIQYINNAQGTPEYVILTVADYNALITGQPLADDENEWDSVPYQAGDDDDETIPHEVVSIMIDDDVSLLAAWRIYRRLSQYDVAEQTGLTQSAISQAERKESKPQRKTLERLAKIYDCLPEQLTL